MTLWGGRYSEPRSDESASLMRRFNDSFHFDRRLYKVDIAGSRAYARAICSAGLLTAAERDAILEGLSQVEAEFDEGRFIPLPTDEDIHTAVERRLTELIGEPGKKLHTGRSRNDQSATDVRLWLLGAIDRVLAAIGAVQQAIVQNAADNPDAIMPGYTHFQPAQPVLYGHWLMSYFWMLARDTDRLQDSRRRAALLPLGSGALAGSPFPIERQVLAADLGFAEVTHNSLDAVSDRDHIAEVMFAAALLGVHLSRLAEDIVLFSNPALGFIRLADVYTTGSSLMPQKRNPDAAELARGKAGRLTGNLVTLLVVLKGLPMTYNKDLQEDKEPLFDTVDTLETLLPVMAEMIASMAPVVEKMQAALDPAMLATDLADYLVARGVPFREAYGLAGQAVRLAEARQIALPALPLAELQAISPFFGSDVMDVFDFGRSVERRRYGGGTSSESLRAQLEAARQLLGRSAS